MPVTSKPEKNAALQANGSNGPVKKAVISAPAGVDTSVLRRLLDRRGITSFYPDEISLPGRTVSEALQEAMAGADLVVLILDAQKNNNNVFLELGVALGMRKRLLVLSPSEEIVPGVLLTGVPVTRANPTETE